VIDGRPWIDSLRSKAEASVPAYAHLTFVDLGKLFAVDHVRAVVLSRTVVVSISLIARYAAIHPSRAVPLRKENCPRMVIEHLASNAARSLDSSVWVCHAFDAG
jgi:hypothetical protein